MWWKCFKSVTRNARCQFSKESYSANLPSPILNITNFHRRQKPTRATPNLFVNSRIVFLHILAFLSTFSAAILKNVQKNKVIKKKQKVVCSSADSLEDVNKTREREIHVVLLLPWMFGMLMTTMLMPSTQLFFVSSLCRVLSNSISPPKSTHGITEKDTTVNWSVC